MNSRLKKSLNLTVYMIWSAFFSYLLISKKYLLFLRPEFGFLVLLADVIAIGFIFAALFRPGKGQLDIASVVRAVILMFPVFCYFGITDTMLSGEAFKSRFVGTASEEKVLVAQNPDMNNDADEQLVADSEQVIVHEVDILQLLEDPYYYNEQKVKVIGMFLHDETLKPYFSGKNTAIYRFLVTCCAADAMPLTVALDLEDYEAFSKYQWVQVEGVFEIQKGKDNYIPVILKPEIKSVEAPAQAYLY